MLLSQPLPSSAQPAQHALFGKGWVRGGGGVAAETIANKMGVTEGYRTQFLGLNTRSTLKIYCDDILHSPCFERVCLALCIYFELYRLLRFIFSSSPNH